MGCERLFSKTYYTIVEVAKKERFSSEGRWEGVREATLRGYAAEPLASGILCLCYKGRECAHGRNWMGMVLPRAGCGIFLASIQQRISATSSLNKLSIAAQAVYNRAKIALLTLSLL